VATRALDRRPIRTVRLSAQDDFDGWREAARALALVGAAPSEVVWEVAGSETGLFGAPAPAPPAPAGLFSVPRAFVALAQQVICHKAPERFALLYAMLVKLRERPDALDDKADPLVHRLEGMARAVRRGFSGAVGHGRHE
jgi:uracil-DNA glycosylase